MLNGLEWQQPWWLLLMAAPLLLLLRPRHDGSSRLAQFIARHLWPRLVVGFDGSGRRRLPLPFLLAWLLASIALAGPLLHTAEPEQEIKRQANIAIILDISPSMRAADVAPTRIGYSRQLLGELAQQLAGERVALIAFSANAYTVLPLSSDGRVLRQMIEALDPALASVTGSNLGRALHLAQEALAAPAPGENTAKGGIVLLVSDGEIHDQGGLTAARQLRQAGHRLYTLGVGSESGAPVPFATGRLISEKDELITSRLDRATLQVLASAGGGRYGDLRPEAWPAILGAIEEVRHPLPGEPRKAATPLFPLLLAAALALFIVSGLRHGAVAALLLALPLLLQSPASEAAPWDEARARTLMEREDFQGALQIYGKLDNYHGHLGRGVAAYRLGRWQQALDAFEGAATLARSDGERARAAYNRGNALVQLGRIEEARSAYKSTLFWQAGHPKANHNLALLEANQPKGGERQGKSDHERQGAGGEESQSRPGGDGESEPQAGLSPRHGEGALQQSLEAWQRRDGSGGQGAAQQQFQQQLNTVKEDYQTMLKQRFAAEDASGAAGLVVERPW